MAILDAGGFSIELISYNYNVSVSVKGNSYSGEFFIFCTKEDYLKFVNEITELYNTLREGKTEIREVYEPNYVCFESDGAGHFIVSGEYNDWGNWRLKFSELLDQTYMKNFVKELNK